MGSPADLVADIYMVYTAKKELKLQRTFQSRVLEDAKERFV